MKFEFGVQGLVDVRQVTCLVKTLSSILRDDCSELILSQFSLIRL